MRRSLMRLAGILLAASLLAISATSAMAAETAEGCKPVVWQVVTLEDGGHSIYGVATDWYESVEAAVAGGGVYLGECIHTITSTSSKAEEIQEYSVPAPTPVLTPPGPYRGDMPPEGPISFASAQVLSSHSARVTTSEDALSWVSCGVLTTNGPREFIWDATGCSEGDWIFWRPNGRVENHIGGFVFPLR